MKKKINLLYIKERASVFLDLYIYLIINTHFILISILKRILKFKKIISYLYSIIRILYLLTYILVLKVYKL